MLLTGLMGYDRARVAPKARQRRRHNIVERAGTQAATDDKHAQWPPARLITLFNRLDPHHGGPDWITYHQGSRQRSEEHTSELQSLMRISYAVFCLKKKKKKKYYKQQYQHNIQQNNQQQN